MSDNTGITTGDGSVDGMPAADAKFLIACLQNTTGGSVSVDTTKIAELLGYKNPRSVGNKLTEMKKKYFLPISGSAGKGSRTPDKTASIKTASILKTPTKNRVAKSRVTSSTKKEATNKSKAKFESGDEEVTKAEESDGAAEHSQEDYEKVFGKPDSDAEADADEI